jgi:hypothetical protein
MGILDLLKPQPRWKHADPSVRLEAVRDLDDAVELATLAEGDADARVRRACVARTSDVAVLSRIAAGDADADTRERAAERLLALASAADTDEAVAVEAVRGIVDGRRLSTLAKSDARDAIRAAALARVDDPRALGSIARHAKHETTAIEALARVEEAKELLETALNADHKDVALAAFERAIVPVAGDLTLLRSVEARAQQKAVAKRARTMIQEIEAAEAARVAAEEDRQRRQAALVEAMGHLSEASDFERAESEVARLADVWAAMPNPDASAAARFEEHRVAALLAIGHRRREAEEASERARLRVEALATREALCTTVEALEGDEMLEQLVPIEEEWRSLMPLVGEGPEADRLAERFARAVAACRKRHELRAVLAEKRLALEALVVEAEGLVASFETEDTSPAKTRWQELSREARGLSATLDEGQRPAPELTDRLAAVGAAFAARESAEREAARKAHDEFVGRLRQLSERSRHATEADALTLREGERLMRDLTAAVDETGHLEPTKDLQEIAAELRRHREQIAPRVRELREMDEWRRFANAQQQEKLIAMAEAIVASLKSDMETGKESDLLATARALKELNAKWQEVAEAPRASAQKLWQRFRIATDFIRARCEGFFSRMRHERDANLQKKTALVEEAESLAGSSDWAKASARIQELQAEWEQTGPIGRDAGRDLSHRFRTACNQFFSRRREDLNTRKKLWSDNLAHKEALCERAEALVDSMDWDVASAEMKRLQAEWKTIGPVRKSRSEDVWKRFRAAADRFFARYHDRHQITLRGKLAEREALVVELEGFATEEAAAPTDLASRVQDLRAAWNRGVPVAAPEMQALVERWQGALARVLELRPDAFTGTDLDPAAVCDRMAKLVARVEAAAADAREHTPEGLSQTELLAARLRSALASNAMGGKATQESRWRAAVDTVKDAQAAWLRLPPAPGTEARNLESRFREACRRVMDHARRHTADSRRNRPMDRPTAAVV